ncbi:MAG: AmmeMemoRadiSam system protein B [Proteobacteria bacterium]|nr:AmmeMemoRadiSam system protein B [Pseudomonadota bacterium]
MKPAFNSAIKLFAIFCMTSVFCINGALADDIRRPVVAGSFYPSNQSELIQTIDSLADRAKNTQVKIPSGKYLKALILPHAGYPCSGLTAAHASLVLSEKQFDKVILLGPDHHIGLINGAISDVSAYQTPLGTVKLHKDAAKLRNQSELFNSNKSSDLREHSLEVLLPFLQHYLKEFEIIPIVISQGDIDGITNEINMFIDQNTLVVASSDLSHYQQYDLAVETDKETIKMILNLDADKLMKGYNYACGKVPILVLVSLARQYGWQPVLLHYSNSGDTCGGRSKVVGYAAIAFYGDKYMEDKKSEVRKFSDSQGQVLVRLARHTLMKKLNKKIDTVEAETLEEALKEDCFQEHFGTFVTLKINGQLRGCIGNITASESLKEGVKRNTISAAFHDPRFSPLRDEELEHVDIEVSILTQPEPLKYRDGDDLIAKLRVNVDGVIIQKGFAGATFLPQVWKQLPRPEEFLSHLCMKAGMSAEAWRNDKLEVKIYQVQYFDEEK